MFTIYLFSGSTVAFSAYLDETKTFNRAAVPFNHVLLNEPADVYNQTSGLFTCPITGVYMFYFVVGKFFGFLTLSYVWSITQQCLMHTISVWLKRLYKECIPVLLHGISRMSLIRCHPTYFFFNANIHPLIIYRTKYFACMALNVSIFLLLTCQKCNNTLVVSVCFWRFCLTNKL